MTAANTYLDIDSATGIPKRITAADAGGSGHENQIPQLDSSGRLATSMMPTGIGAETVTCPASENLAGGDLVNLWSDAGTLKARKADASAVNAGKRADGFVLAAVTSPANATVYLEGSITGLSSLTIGSVYFLSGTAAGGTTTTPPSTTGYLIQRVGRAISETEMTFEPQMLVIA